MRIKTWQMITVIVCIILGIVLHFIYEWSNQNAIVGVFSAINESTWEHLKLIFYPMVLMAILGYFMIGEKSNNYWFAQSIGIVTAMFFIIVFFYTYTGIVGSDFAWLNIATFLIAVILGGVVTYKILTSRKNYDAEKVSRIFIIILLLSFILYTCNPPQIALFQDPLTWKYGI